jgi:hypothetical protein
MEPPVLKDVQLANNLRVGRFMVVKLARLDVTVMILGMGIRFVSYVLQANYI